MNRLDDFEIFFHEEMVREYLNERGPVRRRIFNNNRNIVLDPRHIARRLANGLDRIETDSCWEWRMAVNGDGYGMLTVTNRIIRAHRLAFALGVRAIKKGQVIRHTCDNPPCINPAHLLAGSQADNMQDAIRRGRIFILEPLFSENNPSTKLTPEMVIEIKKRLALGEAQTSIVKDFDISTSSMSRINLGQTWRKHTMTETS